MTLKRSILLIISALAMIGTLPLDAADEDALAELREDILDRPEISARRGAFRRLAVEAVVTKRHEHALDTLLRLFNKALDGEDDTPSQNETRVLLQAADAFHFVATSREKAPNLELRRDVASWMLASATQTRLLLTMLSPLDDWSEVCRLVSQLHAHDPDQRDEFRTLILALAMVWDQPRPPMHRQMGGKQLPFQPDISERYDYFKELFRSGDAEIAYRRLSPTALMTIVDTPVPISELQWVREHVRPSRWQRKFFDIEYDEERLVKGVFQWPHGPYTLEAMEEKGGICVEQAYYATLCARAFGVPALMFTGEGRRGPHAWYGYMKGTEKWEMDIGRYAYDKYATGFAVNPQTNRPLTDHDVTFMCDRALREEVYTEAAAYGRLAFVSMQLGYPAAARDAARRGIDLSPLYDFPWWVLETLEEKKQNWRDLARLLDRKAEVFRRYPDYTARIRTRQAEALRRCGEDEAAERLLTRRIRRVDRDRDDLHRALVSQQVQAAYDAGDYDAAREHFEDLMKDQKDGGQKTIGLLEGYLALTKETNQTEEAAKFMKRYIGSLENQYGQRDHNRIVLLQYLLRAYEHAGDTSNIARTKRKIERLRD